MGLLNKDLTNADLPVAGISIVDHMAGEQRSTYVSYFSGFLRIGWLKEPPENYLSNLSKIVSKHMALTILSDDLIDKTGTFPEISPQAHKLMAVYRHRQIWCIEPVDGLHIYDHREVANGHS